VEVEVVVLPPQVVQGQVVRLRVEILRGYRLPYKQSVVQVVRATVRRPRVVLLSMVAVEVVGVPLVQLIFQVGVQYMEVPVVVQEEEQITYQRLTMQNLAVVQVFIRV
jgi:hypothetical protein